MAAQLAGIAQSAFLRQVMLYGLVSVAALGLDMATFLALKGGGMRAASAAVIGYCVGLLLHFVLSSRFVFAASATGKSNTRLFIEFALTGVVGIAITGLTVAVLTEGLAVQPVAAKAVAIVLSFATVFMLRRVIVFAERR